MKLRSKRLEKGFQMKKRLMEKFAEEGVLSVYSKVFFSPETVKRSCDEKLGFDDYVDEALYVVPIPRWLSVDDLLKASDEHIKRDYEEYLGMFDD